MVRPVGYVSRRTAPTEHPRMLDIAWAAGIFEGEGYAGRARVTNRSGTISSLERIEVVQKDRWLLDRMRAFFGGNVKHHEKHTAFVWWLTGPRARGFLYTIFTFLSPRRRIQVRKALGAEV